MLAYVAASGLVMGIFFKSFTLVVLCLLVALAIVVSAVKAEYGRCAWLRARAAAESRLLSS